MGGCFIYITLVLAIPSRQNEMNRALGHLCAHIG